MVHLNSLKVVFGDELSSLVSLLNSRQDPTRKLLVLLPSYISTNNCQRALLSRVETIQNVTFATFDDFALWVLNQVGERAFDLLDDEVEREATARALRETGQPAHVSADLRENPSFITYVTSVLFELRRNASSISPEKCTLPDGLREDKCTKTLSEFEKQKLASRVDLASQLVDEQWAILEPSFRDRYYTRELAISEATKVLGSSGDEALAEISHVFIGHPYHVDEVLLRFIISIAKNRPTTYWVATTERDDNITSRLEKELKLVAETIKSSEPTKLQPVAAPDVRREIQCIARDVHRRVSAGETSLSELLVVARDAGQYEEVFYEVMDEFEIPAEVQTRQYFKLLAVAHFYDSLLKFASGDDREMAEALVEILETGYPGISEYSTYWMRVKIERLRMSFSALLTDLKDRKPDEPIGGRHVSWWIDQFEKLEKVRDRLQKAESVEDFLKVLISSEPRMGIVEYTSRRLQMYDATSVPRGVRARELEGTLRLLKRLWRLRDAQNQINDTMEVAKVDVKRFRELLEDFFATESYGSSSQSREVIRLVDAGNIDFLRPKRMYMVGLSEGIFPSKMRETAFLGDRACKLLTEQGVAYLQNNDTTRGYEKWLFSNCLGACEEDLSFTYSYLDSDGHPRLYSPFLLSNGLFNFADLEEANNNRILVDSFVGLEATADRDALRSAATLLGKEFSNNQKWELTFQDSALESAFSTISAGAERINKPPPAADIGSLTPPFRSTSFEIDSLNEFSACQFRYYSHYLLGLDPWRFRPYHRVRRFYLKVLNDLIPKFPGINPTRLRRAVEEELERKVLSDEIPNERLLRRTSAIVYGYLASEVQRCRNASSNISSRKMEFARPISLSIDGLSFSGSYDRIDFLDDENCLVVEVRETAAEVRSSFRGISSATDSLPDYRLPFLIEQMRRDGKNVVGVEYHSIKASTAAWLPRQTGFVLENYSKVIAAPRDVFRVSPAQLDKIAKESMERALTQTVRIQESQKFRVKPIEREVCNTCSFSNLCLGPGGIPE